VNPLTIRGADIDKQELQPADFATLAEFRYALRRFTVFSEAEAHAQGLSPQQHQALLTIKGSGNPALTVGELAERLCIKHHSAVELVSRLVRMGMVERTVDPDDARRVRVSLTAAGEAKLQALSAVHLEQLRLIGPLLIKLIDKFGPRNTVKKRPPDGR